MIEARDLEVTTEFTTLPNYRERAEHFALLANFDDAMRFSIPAEDGYLRREFSIPAELANDWSDKPRVSRILASSTITEAGIELSYRPEKALVTSSSSILDKVRGRKELYKLSSERNIIVHLTPEGAPDNLEWHYLISLKEDTNTLWGTEQFNDRPGIVDFAHPYGKIMVLGTTSINNLIFLNKALTSAQ